MRFAEIDSGLRTDLPLPLTRSPPGPPAPARPRARTRAGGHERERERAPASERGLAQWAARAVPTPGKLSLSLISLPFITNTDTITSARIP